MNKTILTYAFALTVAFTLSATDSKADQLKDNTGCGLGTTIFEGKGDNLLFQILAVTTNGTSANQTFGISTGTLGCSSPEAIVKNDVLIFLADNMDSVAADMAMGEGENLDAVAELLEVNADSRAEVFASWQANFDNIFTSEAAQAGEVIDNMVKYL